MLPEPPAAARSNRLQSRRGIGYAREGRHLRPKEVAMKAKKRSGEGKPAGKRGIKDLTPSETGAKKAKGGAAVGSAVSGVIKNFGGALNTAARGG
jgi:hypothetical protein